MTDARVCCLCGTGLDESSILNGRWEPFADSVAHPGCCEDRVWQEAQDQLDARFDA